MTSQILKVTSAFLASPFTTDQKSQNKNLNILRTERAFEINKKRFSSFQKALIEANKQNFFLKVRLTKAKQLLHQFFVIYTLFS